MSMTGEMKVLSQKKEALKKEMSPEICNHYYNFLYKKR